MKLSEEFLQQFGDPGLTKIIKQLRGGVAPERLPIEDEELHLNYELVYHMDHDTPVLDGVHLVKDGKYSENILPFAGEHQIRLWEDQLDANL